jgi:hypothetical protein
MLAVEEVTVVGHYVIRTPPPEERLRCRPSASSVVASLSRCAERFVDMLRRDLLDHVLILREEHLRTVVAAYVCSYNKARPHQALHHEPPVPRCPDLDGRSEQSPC